jgi:glutamine amidotransferase
MRGQTDSELLFHVVMSFLHESGQIDSVDVAHPPVIDALRGAAALVDKLSREAGVPDSSLTLALTNGRQLYALQRGVPLVWTAREGLPRRGSDRPGERRTDHEVRYALIATCASDSVPDGYQGLQDGEAICVDRDLRVTVTAL